MLGFLRQAVQLIYQVIEAIYLPVIVGVLLINSHPRIATPATITGN
jgi:hypothetical protein